MKKWCEIAGCEEYGEHVMAFFKYQVCLCDKHLHETMRRGIDISAGINHEMALKTFSGLRAILGYKD